MKEVFPEPLSRTFRQGEEKVSVEVYRFRLFEAGCGNTEIDMLMFLIPCQCFLLLTFLFQKQTVKGANIQTPANVFFCLLFFFKSKLLKESTFPPLPMFSFAYFSFLKANC